MDKIKVAIKVRPLIEREKAEGCGVCWNVSENSMWPVDHITQKARGEPYCFDHVFGMETSNYDLFETVATPIVNAAVHGFNGTIFAYGQTSSGKTHTMMGTRTEPGIIPLAIGQMFEAISSDLPGRQFLLRASYIEIYNEKINDLLSKKSNLKLREDAGQVVVADLSEEVVHTPDKIIESRNTQDGDGVIQVSHLNLVDLAGSERVEQTGSTGDRLKEGCSINRSLFFLGQVIAQLTDGDDHVSYRDSKLTRILQSSIGGNALTAIVCAVTPAAVEETANTLSFASRAKNIKNRPQVNEVLTEAALLKRYTRKIKELEEELERARNVTPEVSEMQSKLYEEMNLNEQLMNRITRLKENVINSCIKKPQPEALRRRTWCAPRMSSRTSICRPVKWNLPSIAESSGSDSPLERRHSFNVSLEDNTSECTCFKLSAPQEVENMAEVDMGL
ncbi:centromere-associated protein E-like [Bacillus rossius redtenbacheri]|uniref:centromere-associated protein E-like n=1 Tax=Bacillus rossius redtenbacheri TaxID=93214 RepID=UPI002FDD04BE